MVGLLSLEVASHTSIDMQGPGECSGISAAVTYPPSLDTSTVYEGIGGEMICKLGGTNCDS